MKQLKLICISILASSFVMTAAHAVSASAVNQAPTDVEGEPSSNVRVTSATTSAAEQQSLSASENAGASKVKAEAARKDALDAEQGAIKAAAAAQIVYMPLAAGSVGMNAKTAANARQKDAEAAEKRAGACAKTNYTCITSAYNAEMDAYTREAKNRTIVKTEYQRQTNVGIPARAAEAQKALNASGTKLKAAKAAAENAKTAATTSESNARERKVPSDTANMTARKASADKLYTAGVSFAEQGDKQTLIKDMIPLYDKGTANFNQAAALYNVVKTTYDKMPAALPQ